MKCPKCESNNTFQISTGQNICRNCENIFALDESSVNTDKHSFKNKLFLSKINLIIIFSFFGICILLLCTIIFVGKSKSINSISKKSKPIPSELKEMAQNILDYGDYYMEQASKDESSDIKSRMNIMSIGSDLMKEEVDKFNYITRRLYPKISDEQSKIIQECNSSIEGFPIYFGLVGFQVFSYWQSSALGIKMDQLELDKTFQDYVKSRKELIDKCDL